jgi:HK97 family phage major capsid protein
MDLKPYFDAVNTAEAEVTRLRNEIDSLFRAGDQKKALDLRPALDEAKTKAKEANDLYLSMRDAGNPADPARNFKLGADGDLNIGMSGKDVKNYSILRAIRAAADQQNNPRAWDEAGLEIEASRAVAEKLGRQPKGFFVPWEIQNAGYRRPVNTQKAGDPSLGGALVATELLADSFIDVLRNSMALKQAGARVMTGLVGDVDIPKKTTASVAYWIGEGNAPNKSILQFGQVSARPKTVAAYAQLTRKFLKQATPDAEMLVRDDIAQTLAVGADRAGLHGAGSANEPMGVALMSGIGAVVGGTNGATPDWADIVDLEAAIAIDNALLGKLGYITNSAVQGYLKKTRHNATYGDQYIWPINARELNGYPAWVSNQVRSDMSKGSSGAVCSGIFFGNWDDLVFLYWGGLDVIVDPYTNSTSGDVLITAMQDLDIVGRRVQSFSAMLDAKTA